MNKNNDSFFKDIFENWEEDDNKNNEKTLWEWIEKEEKNRSYNKFKERMKKNDKKTK